MWSSDRGKLKRVSGRINLDEVYVLNQPSHAMLSIVFSGDTFPLRTETHESLLRLLNVSDVIFIFPPGLNIDERKFTSLYQGCGLVVSGGLFSKTLLRTLEYGREIFNQHSGFLITDLTYISPDINGDFLIRLLQSTVNDPVIEINRRTSENYWEIYSGKLNRREFSSFESPSKLCFLRPGIVDIITKLKDEKYITSFCENNIRYFLASVIKYLGLKNITPNEVLQTVRGE